MQNQLVAKMTVANGGTTSNAVLVSRSTIFGLETPAGLTSLTFKFQGARYFDPEYESAAPWRDIVKEDGTAMSFTFATVGASKNVGFDTFNNYIAPWPWVRIVTAGAEGAERVFYLVAKEH